MFSDNSYLTGELLNNRNVFPTVLETGKSKIEVSAELRSAEGSLPGAQAAPSGCVLT